MIPTFEPIPVHNEKRQTLVGLVVFAFFFWLAYLISGKLGAELDHACEIISQMGERCPTGAALSMLFYLAFAGCIFLGYLGYRFSYFLFQREK